MTRRDLTALAEEVVEHLDGEWAIEPFPADWGRLGAWLREDKEAILSIGETQVYADRNKSQLVVSTDYPRDRDGRTSSQRRPKISVSTSKTGAQIAKDISRRLFPEYLPLLEKEIASTVAYNKHGDDSARLAQQIADLVQVSRSPKETTVSFYHSPYFIFKDTMSKAEVVGGNRVEITFDVNSETALKILNQLLHGRYELP